MPHRWGAQQFSAPPNTIDAAIRDLGRPFSAYSVYSQLEASPDLPREVNDWRANGPKNGVLVYRNINCVDTVGGKKVGIDYASVWGGRHDDAIRAYAEWVKGCGIPKNQLIITFQHEPSIANGNQPKVGDSSGPAYQRLFKYFFDKMVSFGATRQMYRTGFYPVVANFASHTHKGTAQPPIADEFYPGDSYVDVIGMDFYNHVDSGADSTKKLADAFAYAKAHGKKTGFGEIGDTDDTGRPEWITWLAGAMLANPDVVHASWNMKDHYGLGQPEERRAWLNAAKSWQ